jgi:NADH:ubiquinone oxidoreductase subunit 3 (subunit A)
MFNKANLMLLLNNSLVKTEYTGIFIFIIFSIVLTVLIISFSYVFVKQNPEPDKLSAYECGFEPLEGTRHAFDIKFCVIAILFLLFDIELTFIVPWCVSVSKMDLLSFWSMLDFILELCVGFFYV